MYDDTHVASQIPKIKDYFTELLVKENLLFIFNDETKHLTSVNMFKGE